MELYLVLWVILCFTRLITLPQTDLTYKYLETQTLAEFLRGNKLAMIVSRKWYTIRDRIHEMFIIKNITETLQPWY